MWSACMRTILLCSENRYSHAFFYQRVRLQPVFKIAEGLTFTARMDALEKQWGNTNWKGNCRHLGRMI